LESTQKHLTFQLRELVNENLARKHAILLATVILTARRLQPLLEEDDKASKPNMATEFWAEAI
jgi:hypothetical protein